MNDVLEMTTFFASVINGWRRQGRYDRAMQLQSLKVDTVAGAIMLLLSALCFTTTTTNILIAIRPVHAANTHIDIVRSNCH